MKLSLRLLLIRVLPASAGLRLVVGARPSRLLPLGLSMTLALALDWPWAVAGSGMPVLCGEHDLELVQLIPFRVGSIPFRYRTQRLQTCAR